MSKFIVQKIYKSLRDSQMCRQRLSLFASSKCTLYVPHIAPHLSVTLFTCCITMPPPPVSLSAALRAAPCPLPLSHHTRCKPSSAVRRLELARLLSLCVCLSVCSGGPLSVWHRAALASRWLVCGCGCVCWGWAEAMHQRSASRCPRDARTASRSSREGCGTVARAPRGTHDPGPLPCHYWAPSVLVPGPFTPLSCGAGISQGSPSADRFGNLWGHQVLPSPTPGLWGPLLRLPTPRPERQQYRAPKAVCWPFRYAVISWWSFWSRVSFWTDLRCTVRGTGKRSHYSLHLNISSPNSEVQKLCNVWYPNCMTFS